MKTLKITIAVLLIVSGTALYGHEVIGANGTAGVHKEASITVKASDEEGIFNLVYEADEARDIEVVLYNEQNQKLHQQTVKGKSRFLIPFNLKQLPYGVYTVEVRENGREHGKVHHEQIAYRPLSPAVEVAYSKQEDDRLALSILGANGESVRVLIYDENSNLLYQDTIEGQANFNRVYNFEQAGIDKAEFIVSYKNKIVSNQTIKF